MIDQTINIICLEKTGDLSRFISSVYGAIAFRLKQVQSLGELSPAPEQEEVHLYVVDNAVARLSPKDMDYFRNLSPRPNLILVTHEDEDITVWKNLNDGNLYCLTQKEIVTKLPRYLGEIYANLSQKSAESPQFQKLLTTALDKLDPVIIICNQHGQFVFLNESGRRLLRIEDVTHADFFVQDYLTDGAKIWHFLQDFFTEENIPLRNYHVTLVNDLLQQFPGQAVIRKLTLEQVYFLFKVSLFDQQQAVETARQKASALPDFADAVANELLNPVNVISGRLQLLEKLIKDDPQLASTLGGLQKQIQRINETIHRLVTFASLKQENILRKVPLDEILKRLQKSPALQAFITDQTPPFSLRLENEVPLLMGQPMDFEILFGIILNLSLQCLAQSGTLELAVKKTLHNEQEYVSVFFILHKKDINNLDCQLQKQLKIEKSIDTSIAKHIIYTYNGEIEFHFLNSNTEQIEIKFPIANPFNMMEAQ